MNHLFPLFESEDTYKKKVDVDVYYKFKDYLGYEINNITCADIEISFYIYIGYKSWGINEVSVFRIKGPEEIPMLVSYYKGDTEYENELLLPFSWEDVIMEDVTGTGVFTVDRLEIELDMDYAGINFNSHILGKPPKIGINKITAQTNSY